MIFSKAVATAIGPVLSCGPDDRVTETSTPYVDGHAIAKLRLQMLH